MPLDLPPASVIRQSEENARQVHSELTQVIANYPRAKTTYQFYEEIDNWLGPWGPKGYPIGYGKFYNIAFSTNSKILANPTAKAWAEKTTIFLQEALRDFIVDYFRKNPLVSLTEPILRAAAFASHPKAYDKGGLATLAMVAPEMIPVISSIPAAEFNPRSKNFDATVKQVFVTAGLVGPKVVGSLFASMAGPAHNGSLRMAAQRDRQRFQAQTQTSQQLGMLRQQLQSGKLDYIPVLDKLIAELQGTKFPDQGFARVAREIILQAQTRRKRVQANTNLLLRSAPEVRANVRKTFPETFAN